MTHQRRAQGYAHAQQQASNYLAQLQASSHNEQVFNCLVSDIQSWRHSAAKLPFAHQLSFFNSPAFISKLAGEKKLKQYLQDSIGYLFVRDLDLQLGEPDVNKQIDQLADALTTRLTARDDHGTSDVMLEGFRWARQHNAEQAFIWLSAKVYQLNQTLPDSLAEHQGIRKLLKVVAGVLMNAWHKGNTDFEQAIRLGYYYGLTYPLIDDLQDSQTLTKEQKQSLDSALEQSIVTGRIHRPSEQTPWLSYVFDELAEAFSFIQQHQGDHFDDFLDQAYIFFKAQQHGAPAQENQLWLNMINKSSRSRILANALVTNQVRHGNYQYFGLFNQLHDDLKDIELDYQEGNLTPFVALVYHNKLIDGVHPYKLYWTLVHYLIYQCYDNEPTIKQLILKRCINSHKSLLEQLGKERFNERLAQLTQNCPQLGELRHTVLSTLAMPLQMAWLDKYLSHQLHKQLSATHTLDDSHSVLSKRIAALQTQIKSELPLTENHELAHAGNYSLAGGGKYFRSVLCALYAQDCLGLAFSDIAPVVRFIEYMHTASLIFDDKPSQDNSDLRRGQPTLHRHLQSEAKAEITAVNLIFKAVEVHASLTNFSPDHILQSLTYASQVSQQICHGQWLDLDAQGKTLNISELENISLKKTAYAIESALLLPAMLVGKSEQHIAQLKQFARHLGIAFQIKDDLLDVEADNTTLGKPRSLDEHNQTATFVRCLGRHGASEQLYFHYYRALDAISDLDNTQALRQLASWVIARNR